MKTKHIDFTIRPNTQSERIQEDLWDVMIGGTEVFTITQGRKNAQALADQLNQDPYTFERGQTRMHRGGAINYERT